jgi:hypothetical protein
MKAKLNALADLANRAYAKTAVGLLVTAPLLARAQVAPDDVGPVVLVILAAIPLVVLIGNAKLLVQVALRTYGWLKAAMR